MGVCKFLCKGSFEELFVYVRVYMVFICGPFIQ